MADDFTPLTIQAYSKGALETDRKKDSTSLNFPLLGLFGEIGSLLSEVKKKQRDPIAYRAYAAAVAEEIGDVLWYLNLVAARGGLTLADIVTNLGTADDDPWQSASGQGATFEALQPQILGGTKAPSPVFEETLIKLAAEVGMLLASHSDDDLGRDKQKLGRHLVRILDELINAANEAGISLEAAAVKNQKKTLDRWPLHLQYPNFFDEHFPAAERLPRHLTIDIYEREVSGKRYVFQTCNGINIGDRLTDNAMEADDYRFHDVFHYANVAVLGWSPVTRSLLRLKRKSDPKIDEAQDGARAALIEEGIATWIFGQAKEMDFFVDVGPGDLPFDVLKRVRQFVAGYEAEQCPAWLWEKAILQGYAAFRCLKENRRGRIIIDAMNRRLNIEALP